MDKGERTRERIIEAALPEFIEHGFEATSLRMVMGRAGVSTGSLYHQYSSKDALFEAVVERYLSDYVARSSRILGDETLSLPECIDMVLDEAVGAIRGYDGLLRSGGVHWTMQLALHDMALLKLLPAMTCLVERGISNGSVVSRLDADARTVAAVLLKGIEGMLHGGSYDLRESDDVARLKACVREYVALVISSRS